MAKDRQKRSADRDGFMPDENADARRERDQQDNGRARANARALDMVLDLIAETVPKNLISQIFGFSHAASAGMGLVLAAVVGVLLAQIAFPLNYASVYLISILLLALSWFALHLVDEMPHDGVPKSRQSFLE